MFVLVYNMNRKCLERVEKTETKRTFNFFYYVQLRKKTCDLVGKHYRIRNITLYTGK